ncbi:hypothetical protein INR49_010459 [Caranx melampygus]|nr:hypothetical protein INR49_010459 [Caranx melampygus]
MLRSSGGFYSQRVRPGLRLLSLNTVLYYSPDKVTANDSDPAGQFQWLESTLEEAGRSREKVYIIAHVPVGYLPFARNTTAVRQRHNDRLVAIFRKYSQHVSEPYSNNPSFRMYLYDDDNFTVLDLWQFYLNLTEANLEQRSDWRLEYVMTEAFGVKDLRPSSLLQLGLSFRLRYSSTFARYFTHFMVGYNTSLTCEGQCKVNQVCAVLYLDQTSYSRCVAEGAGPSHAGSNG